MDLGQIESAKAPMVLVGRPCDIASARKAAVIRPGLRERLGLTILIFCGGTPSTSATLELLGAMGVERDRISDLRYRGHGWPGNTGVAIQGSEKRIEIPYRQAWDTILTKHKPFRCLICPDGTGEFSDIACGNPWYRAIAEGEMGSSLILVRSERGRRVLREAVQAGYVIAEPRTADVLPRSQPGLLARRRSVWPKQLCARLLGWPFPRYKGMPLFRNWLGREVRGKWTSLRRAAGYILALRRRGKTPPRTAEVEQANAVHPISAVVPVQ